MGRVRTKTVKKASRVIIEKYYTKLTLDFDINKRIIEEVALIPSKPLRNKIAGFITHLVRNLVKIFYLIIEVVLFCSLQIKQRIIIVIFKVQKLRGLRDVRLVFMNFFSDETSPAINRPRHLHQVAGRGARAKGQLRARRVRP